MKDVEINTVNRKTGWNEYLEATTSSRHWIRKG